MQNWFVLTEKFQVLKICLRKIPKFASGNFFNVAILVRFCSRVLLDDSAVLNFAPEFSQTASPSEFCLRQVRYLAPKSFNFTFSSLRLENLPPAWKFAPGEVLSISPQFCPLHIFTIRSDNISTRSLRDLVAKYSATRPLPSYYRNFLAMKKKKGEGVEKKGGWGPPINPKKTIKPLKFIKETTLKTNWRNQKKADY